MINQVLKKIYQIIKRDLIIGLDPNFKDIPIIIISFNQLFYLKKLISFLKKNQYSNIVIIDNNSKFPPLLDYLESLAPTVTIYRLKDNLGHLAFWKIKKIYRKYYKGYYVITDADVVPCESCPENFLKYFKNILDKNNKVTKVGFSLLLDDIPQSNPHRDRVIKWESQFYDQLDEEGNFKAALDTTFALYRPLYLYDKKNFFNSIRTKKPYQAKHGGWYLDINNLTVEQKFYMKTANSSSSWRFDEKGNLINPMYRDI